MTVATAIKLGMFALKHWKKILGACFIILFLIILVPVILMASFMPGGEEKDVQSYIQVGNELGISWQDLITFDMVLHENELEGRDPNDSAKYFLQLRYEEFEPAESKCVKEKDGECLEYKQIPEKVTYSKTIKGYDQIEKFLRSKGGSKKSIKETIDSINSRNDTRLIVTALDADQAMVQAKFTKDQKDEFYDLQKSGVLEELYPSYQDFGLIPGACINNVSPDGKAKANATVQAYTKTIQKYANQFGVPQYVEVIKAMMMAESGGSGGDPMQSSESGFANEIGTCKSKSGAARMGCITSPEDSIKVGVQVWKSTLTLANYDIAVAIQSYNFGPYFSTWIREHGGKYTVEAAELYSETVLASAGQGLGTPTHAQKVLTRYYEQPGCAAGSISPDMIGANDWVWPTKSKRVTATFDEIHGGAPHNAIDIGAVTPGVAGDPVWSMEDGVVIQVGPITNGGRAVYIQHANNVISRYIHLLSYNVQVGEKVTKGQVIAHMGGSSGTRTTVVDNAYAIHLDFQIKINGVPVDPLLFFPNMR